MIVERIFDLQAYIKEKFNRDDIFGFKVNGKWLKYSNDDYINYSNYISYGLLALGVRAGDKIATISNNRPELNFIEMGILQIGAIHVPVYPTISESDYAYILHHSETKYLFISGDEIYRKISPVLTQLNYLLEVFSFAKLDMLRTFEEFIDIGMDHLASEKLDALKAGIKTDDIAMIIYTSGTTGFPKGVMLSHYNLISNFIAASVIPPKMGKDSRAISFLPLCHAYEKMINYMYQYIGLSVYYVESLGTINENIKEIEPEIMTAVPRLIDKIHYKIISNGRKQKGLKKKIFFWAIELANKFELYHKNGLIYDIKLKIADMLIYHKIRKALGGRMKLIVSGGAALQPFYARFFWAAGICLMEGYGMTETSPVIAVGTFEPNSIRFGTVGPVLNGVQVKIAQDGEILCKGPNIMQGYYKDEQLTKEVIDTEGWMHTGDLGQIEDGRFLRITGRKKDLFKTSSGKYIVPQLIENKFKESLFIDNIIVIGENQKFAAALIVPDFIDLRSWSSNKGIEYTSDKEMITLPAVKQRFMKEVKMYNSFFGDAEQIIKFELVADEWTIMSGELTPTLKLKRQYITEKYKVLIEKIYRI